MEFFLCRTCFFVNESSNNFKPMKDVRNVLQLVVPQIIPSSFRDDTLICCQCYYFLKNIEKFQSKCIEVQRKLKNYNVEMYKDSFTNKENWRVDSLYSSRGINKDTEISHTFVPERPVEETTTDSEFPAVPTAESKQTKHSSSVTSESSSSKIPKSDVNQTIEVIEINDYEVELKIAVTSETDAEDRDDIFTEEIGEAVLIKQEIKEDNPSFYNIQSKEGLYCCKLCDKKYKSSKGLYEHTQNKHTELKFFHCNSCNFFTLWKSALSRHVLSFHSTRISDNMNNNKTKTQSIDTAGSQVLHCYHCSFKTAYKSAIEEHLKDVHFNSSVIKYAS